MCTPPMQPTQPPFTWLGDFILFRSELLHSLSVVGAFSLRECLFSPIEFSLQHLILSTSSPYASDLCMQSCSLQRTRQGLRRVGTCHSALRLEPKWRAGHLAHPYSSTVPPFIPPLLSTHLQMPFVACTLSVQFGTNFPDNVYSTNATHPTTLSMAR